MFSGKVKFAEIFTVRQTLKIVFYPDNSSSILQSIKAESTYNTTACMTFSSFMRKLTTKSLLPNSIDFKPIYNGNHTFSWKRGNISPTSLGDPPPK